MAGDNTKSLETAQAIFKKLKAGKSNRRLKPYLMKARWIAQSIHPFMNIRRIFYAGIPEGNLDSGDEDGEEQDYSADEVKAFEAVMRLERGFREVVDACADDTGVLAALIQQVNDAAGRSRSDDVSSLKSGILEYIYEDPKKGSRFSDDIQSERILSSDSKELRGFRNIDTADHLCPLILKAEFENDPMCGEFFLKILLLTKSFSSDFMEKFEDGKIEITAADLPSFLYESGTIYDPADEATGLLRGFLIVRVFRHIFTGPKSALGLEQDGRNKNKARIFQLKEVTPRTIAYACVQTYIALSNMKRWKASDGPFHLEEFYDDIVSIFEENADCSWALETLEWWNNQIPGLRSRNRKVKSTIRSSVKDARIPAAKRIGTQLASRTLKGRVSNTPTHDDDPLNAVDDGYTLDGNVLDLDDSSTEPASSDKEEHGLWKRREQIRKMYRKEKHVQPLLEGGQWEEEFRQERERRRREEGHHEEPEGHRREERRHEEVERHHGSEHRLRGGGREEPDHRRQEGRHDEYERRETERRKEDERREEAERRKQGERREEAERRKEAEHREVVERRKEDERRVEAERRKEDKRREEAERRKEVERREETDRQKEDEHRGEAQQRKEVERHEETDRQKEDERRGEAQQRKEAEHGEEAELQDNEHGIEQSLKPRRVNLKLPQKKTTRSSKKRLMNSDETEPELQPPKAKRACQSQPVRTTRKRVVS